MIADASAGTALLGIGLGAVIAGAFSIGTYWLSSIAESKRARAEQAEPVKSVETASRRI